MPAPQWAVDVAKIPTPEIAAKSPAVILFEEHLVTVEGPGQTIERNRTVTRILTAQGRNYAHCGISFDVDEKLNYLHAWSISADGREFQAKEADFVEVGDTKDRIMLTNQKVRGVRPPGADPGASIVCESEKRIRSYATEGLWNLQSSIPVLLQSFEVDLPAGRVHMESWHRFTAIKPTEVVANHWRWEVRNTPALDLRDIPSRPEKSALTPRFSVQWGDAAVANKEDQWRALGQWMDQLELHRPDPSPEITAKAQELIAGAPDFYSRLSRITEYIQRNVRYFIIMRGIGGYQANPASQIYRNRYGDCKDKTTILISMLQAVGIPAHYVFVDTERGVVDPDSPSLAGNHMITAIEVPPDIHDPRLMALVKGKSGKQYLIFDPTNEQTSVGNLPSYLQGSYGGLASGAESQLIPLPILDPKANGGERKGTFKLLADGTISGAIESSYFGSEGGRWRSWLKYSDDKEQHDELEHSIGEQISGVSLDSYKFDKPDSLDRAIALRYQVTAHQYARVMGSLLLFRPRIEGSHALPFDDKPRTLPIELGATGHWHDTYEIELPEGYKVDELPDPVSLDLEFAAYHSSFEVKDKVLRYERDYTVRQIELSADKATIFRMFEGKILADEKANAVLKKQ